MLRLAVAIACLALSAGCDAITGVGSLVEGSFEAGADTGTPDATVPEASPDAPGMADAPPDAISMPGDSALDAPTVVPDAACTPCTGAPQGWTAVGYASPPSSPCPAGFTTSDRIRSATAANGACTCSACTVTSPPSCSSTPITTLFDSGGGACNSSGLVISTPNACANIASGISVAADVELDPPATSGGSCTGGPAKLDPSKISTSPVRLCLPCTGASCGALPSGAFASCVMAQGDQACPTGFSNHHRVGTGASGTCDDCSCTVGGTCGGSVTFYSGSNCTLLSYGVAIDGSCTATPNTYVDMPVGAYKWDPSTMATCSTQAPSPSLTLDNLVTVCCQ